MSIKIICLTTKEVFISQREAERKYNIFSTHICRCCKGKQKSAGIHPETGEKLVWMYYEDYLKLND